MEHDFEVLFKCFKSIFLCFMLSVTYLVSLHVWNSPYSRDHPSTIKKRFISVFAMLFISPCFLYIGLDKKILEEVSFLEILGLKSQGLCPAIFLPLILTMVLFLGPISMEIWSGVSKIYAGNKEGKCFPDITNLMWIRNHIVAPISEEFTYRSCMLPVLLQCFTPGAAIFSCPLFFGVAHLHHHWERIKHLGMSFDVALKISWVLGGMMDTQLSNVKIIPACSDAPSLVHFGYSGHMLLGPNNYLPNGWGSGYLGFQFTYTTLFGIYSAFIFYRTGHFVSVVAVHAFCNHMGFPEILEILTYKPRKKIIIVSLFFIGFGAWCFLMKPLTEPSLFQNKLYL